MPEHCRMRGALLGVLVRFAQTLEVGKDKRLKEDGLG